MRLYTSLHAGVVKVISIFLACTGGEACAAVQVCTQASSGSGSGKRRLFCFSTLVVGGESVVGRQVSAESLLLECLCIVTAFEGCQGVTRYRFCLCICFEAEDLPSKHLPHLELNTLIAEIMKDCWHSHYIRQAS